MHHTHWQIINRIALAMHAATRRRAHDSHCVAIENRLHALVLTIREVIEAIRKEWCESDRLTSRLLTWRMTLSQCLRKATVGVFLTIRPILGETSIWHYLGAHRNSIDA